jgi:hypothetical protein
MLNEIADTGLPVHVNKEREEYTDELQSTIDEVEIGNVVEAEIQSESITQQDDTWKFIELEITDETRFHFIEGADTHSSHVEQLNQTANKAGEDTVRTTISSDGEPIGLITVGEDQGDKFWNGLRMGMNTHEFDIQNLQPIDDPPYEVIYARTSDEEQLIIYHFAEKGTRTAQAIVSANSVESSQENQN